MSTTGIIAVKGIKTAPNRLSLEPGSLVRATNCVILTRDVLEPRRGQPISTGTFGSSGAVAVQLAQWNGYVLVHYGAAGDTAGTNLGISAANTVILGGVSFSAIGSLVTPNIEQQRTKFAELSGNLYATNLAGPVVLTSVSTSLLPAGVGRPYGFAWNGTLQTPALTGNPSASGSWMPVNTSAAYRMVVGRKDTSNNIKLSPPSERVIVINPADLTQAVGTIARTAGSTVTATVAAHNYQVGDIFALSPGEADFAAGNYTVTSVTVTTIVWTNAGANVTNAVQQTISSGTKSVVARCQLAQAASGSAYGAMAGDFVQLYRTENATAAVDPGDECFQAYERTITSTDITNGYVDITDTTPTGFLGAALYTNANTGEGILQTNEPPPKLFDICVMDSRLFGVQATGRQALQLRLIGVGSPNGLQTGDFVGLGNWVYTVTATTNYLPSRNILITAQRLKTQMATATSPVRKQLCVVDLNGITVTISVEDVALNGSVFYAASSRASAWANPLPTVTAVDEANTSRTGITVTLTTSTAHGLTAGNTFVLAYGSAATPDANFPAGLKTVVTAASTSTLTYTESGAASTMAATTAFVYAATYASSAETKQLRYSKQGQPEAWPETNWIGGLPDGQTLLRAANLRGTIYCFFQGGDIYTVSGTYPYTVSKFDGTATLLAADTLVEHAGRLHCLTTQGVVAISESGVEVLSTDIEDLLRDFLANDTTAPELANSFAVSYESDRQYILWLDPTTGDRFAYVYHSNSGQWTKWEGNRTCGLVEKTKDRLMLGGGADGDAGLSTNYLRVENKSYLRTDYADFVRSGISGTIASTTFTPSSASDITGMVAGDVVSPIAGSTFAIVVANNGSTLTLDRTLSSGGFNLYWQVATAVEWAPDSGGTPGVDKNWREVQLHFDGVQASELVLGFSNEKTNTEVTSDFNPDNFTPIATTEATGIITLRAGINQNTQRGASLSVSMTVSEALAQWSLLGISKTLEPIGPKTGKS